MAPIIGITTYGRTETKVRDDAYDAHFSVPAAYVDAVRRAGGTVVLLPPGEAAVGNWLRLVDGLVFAGGADIAPGHYGGDAGHPHLGEHDPERDRTEFALIRDLLQTRGIPALFVCRGMQALNVALNGTLHEHIADLHPENIHQGVGTFWADHPVSVTQGSGLSAIVRQDSVVARSGNHQGVKALGDGLHVTAVAADGIAAAIEHPDHPFILGVQWHPETTAHEDTGQQRIFEALVAAAARQRRR